MVSNSRLMRVDPEFSRIVNFVRAKYIMEGKKPPSATNITKVLAKGMNKEELLKDVFIKF